MGPRPLPIQADFGPHAIPTQTQISTGLFRAQPSPIPPPFLRPCSVSLGMAWNKAQSMWIGQIRKETRPARSVSPGVVWNPAHPGLYHAPEAQNESMTSTPWTERLERRGRRLMAWRLKTTQPRRHVWDPHLPHQHQDDSNRAAGQLVLRSPGTGGGSIGGAVRIRVKLPATKKPNK